MAIATNPSVKLTIAGDDVTSFEETVSFTLSEKIEKIMKFKDTDGDVTIDVSDIVAIEAIIFYSESNAFNVKIDSTEIAVDSGFFVLHTNQTWLDTITTLAVNTAETSDVTVYCFIYGESA